ncbi:TPA: hypothetical protein JD645_RS18300 [Proteus mirabilis]|nr:hypothetical protein [Proteus mirabilis]
MNKEDIVLLKKVRAENVYLYTFFNNLKNEEMKYINNHYKFNLLAETLKDAINKNMFQCKHIDRNIDVCFSECVDLYSDLIVLSNKLFNRQLNKSVFYNQFYKKSKVISFDIYLNEIKDINLNNYDELKKFIIGIFNKDINYLKHLVNIKSMNENNFYQHVFKYSLNFKTIIFYILEHRKIKKINDIKVKINKLIDILVFDEMNYLNERVR